MTIKSYRELEVWQKAFLLSLLIYKAAKKFPKEELYGLASQIRRAVVAIATNIAEGSARGHLAEYIQFLRIAYASGAEVETLLLLSKELGYLADRDYSKLNDLLNEIMKMLNVMIRKLENKTLPKT